MKSIKTITVVEMADGEILGITSFPKNKDGKRDAKIHMYDVIKENNPKMLDEEIELAVEEGSFYTSDYSAKIVEGE